jgi:hypothetical protein
MPKKRQGVDLYSHSTDPNGNAIRRVKLPGQGVSIWTTKQQAKEIHQNQVENHQQAVANANAANPGTPPAPPTTSPIDLTGLGTPPATPGVPTGTPPAPPNPDTAIPSWWIGNAITNPGTEEQKFANVANALLPTLSPEDQRTLASYLATNYKDVYGGYANTQFTSAPTEITDAVRQQYLNPQRAQLALSQECSQPYQSVHYRRRIDTREIPAVRQCCIGSEQERWSGTECVCQSWAAIQFATIQRWPPGIKYTE